MRRLFSTLQFSAIRHSLVLFAVATVGLVAGCAGQRPLFNYAPDGTKIQVKRYPRFSETSQPPRIRSVAFRHNSKLNVQAQKVEQAEILEEYGQPDYLRVPYKSTRGDRVREWAYLEANKLYQFVNHTLVYEGKLSDKDRVLIQYGYPDRYLLQDDVLGRQRETFVYHNEFDTHQQYYSFNDDKLIFGKVAH